MALTGEHKSFRVLDYHVNNSVISVQRNFRTKYRINPPTGKGICKWYVQFRDSGCICERKSNWGRDSETEFKIQNGVDFILQVDSAPPHNHGSIRDHVNGTL
ncbi:hypothetical protein ANN_13745 [Periplaneta americana]|uniref:DUF4817 domain-containing protein n=1 Tax=Periplaneta americana TaxID=6978 RepID=A0ABQ8SVW6_PERAM|nr:hypothetical protein ANN_13745 [Periplaneta americana]